jgi:hypothetical protein
MVALTSYTIVALASGSALLDLEVDLDLVVHVDLEVDLLAHVDLACE